MEKQGKYLTIDSGHMAAVSNAGGLGILSFNAGFEKSKSTPEDTAEEMRKVVRRTKELTDKPFGINVMTAPFDAAGFSKATIDMCRAAHATKEDILNTGADDLIVLTEAGGFMKWRSTPHKMACQALEENRKGNMKPSTESFYEGMLKGNLDAGINTVSIAAALIKNIVSCEDIVNELARGYE